MVRPTENSSECRSEKAKQECNLSSIIYEREEETGILCGESERSEEAQALNLTQFGQNRFTLSASSSRQSALGRCSPSHAPC
jgi:hypothetical protein